MGRTRNIFLATVLVFSGPGSAYANPQGAQVVGGAAAVSGQGTSTVTVNQSSQNAIINWTTFNIGAGERTQFIQPNSSSIALNRVTGGLGPSSILGTLQANGRVFVVNPDGVLFGAGAVIDTAGFLATTSDIKNENFMSGNYRFDIAGRPNASVVNLGSITAQNSGFAALVAPGVRNAGTISAQMGTVGLASGNGFTLDFYGDKLITLNVSDSVAGQVKDVATGQTLASLVTNTGKLSANGGRVELSAVSARQIVDSVINTSGVIEANTVGTRAGKIVLGGPALLTKLAGAPRQTVKVAGTLSASGKNAGEKGGVIQITGEDIRVASANIDASGITGGGRILIGGDVGGGAGNAAVSGLAQAALEAPSLAWPIANASFVAVDAATLLDASAKGSGDGGKVVVWADQTTQFAGQILAKAGTAFGNGGFAEVSGKGTLNFTGSVDLSAPNGRAGTLLLDPRDYYIVGNAQAAPEGASSMSAGALGTLLEKQNVVITTASDGSQRGNIVVSADVSWASAHSLTLSAYRGIKVNAVMTSSGGGDVILRADNTGRGRGTVKFGYAEGSDNLGHITTDGAVAIFYNPRSYHHRGGEGGGEGEGQTAPMSKYERPTDFSGFVSRYTTFPPGEGSTQFPGAAPSVFSNLSAYMLVNTVRDLQAIGTNVTTLGGTYALGRDIDASATATWNDGAGFKPIGAASAPFTGVLLGLSPSFGSGAPAYGATISNLTIASTAQFTGLFGYTSGAALIRDVNLRDAAVTASGNDASAWVGTLVAFNNGIILRSSATGSVKSDTSYAVGGLVGENRGTISQSFADVAVTGSAQRAIGGLAGTNFLGTVIDSYALGRVTAGTGSSAAGLVGINSENSTIRTSYAAGLILTDDSTSGGLVAKNYGTIIQSYWDTQATQQSTSAGGTGLTTAAFQGSLPDGFRPAVWSTSTGQYPTLPNGSTGQNGGTGTPSDPASPSNGAPNGGITTLPNQQVAILSNPTVPGNFNQPPPVVTPPPPGSGGLPGGGGQGAGGSGNGGTGGLRGAGPQPGPGLDRTLAEQTISGVPPANETRFVSNEVVLQVSSTVSRDQVEGVARSLGMTIVRTETLDAGGRTIFTFQGGSDANIRAIIRTLESNRIIASAQPNYVFGLSQNAPRSNAGLPRAPPRTAPPVNAPAATRAAPSPPIEEPAAAEPAAADSVTTQSLGAYDTKQYDPAQYVIEKLKLGAVHRRALGDKVVVALIDSQIDVQHPDLAGVVTDSYDATGSPAKPHAHGTGMAGAIAARKSILGVAPGVKLLAVRAFSETQASAESTSFQILKGIDWAIAKGARVINMSFAGPYDPMMERALKNAKDKGIVLVAAAGNAGPTSPPLYPGADPSVIAVTATDSFDQGFKGANRGKYVAVSAPGVDILAASADGQYQFTTGTSVAAAHVSGLAALLLSRRPALDPDSVRQVIVSSARPLGPKKSEQFGAGLIDPEKALNALELRVPDRVSGN